MKESIKKFFAYMSIFGIIWLYSMLFRTIDYDLWARLAVGKIFFQIGQVLKHDIFSYTETKPLWVDHEWGSGVVFYFLADRFGDLGLLLFKVVLTFLILFIISKIIQLQNPEKKGYLNILWYFLALLGIFYGIGSIIRCQLFTFVFFSLWIYVLERVRRGETRLLWIIPATSLIWANLHGGFVSGLGLLGIYGIGELLNRKPFLKYFLILIPATLITLINPYGVKYWEFIFHAATMSRITISEWMATGIYPLDKWKGFKIFTLAALITVLFNFINFIRIKPKLNDWIQKFNEIDKVKYLLVLITFYLAMKHVKHQPLFVISAASFLYHDFYRIFNVIKNYLVSKFGLKAEELLNKTALVKDILLYSSIIALSVLWTCFLDCRIVVDTIKYPVGSVEFIKTNNLKGNILTIFHWGSYTAWKLYPDSYIAEDGRYEEVYPEKIHLKVYDFNYRYSEKWLDITKAYHTDIIIMEKYNASSYIPMLQNKDWKQIYEDQAGAVFVPANKAKKFYIMPKITEKITIKDKYKTRIDFQ